MMPRPNSRAQYSTSSSIPIQSNDYAHYMGAYGAPETTTYSDYGTKTPDYRNYKTLPTNRWTGEADHGFGLNTAAAGFDAGSMHNWLSDISPNQNTAGNFALGDLANSAASFSLPNIALPTQGLGTANNSAQPSWFQEQFGVPFFSTKNQQGAGNTILGGVNTAWNIYSGLKQYGLAKKNLAFQKDAFNKNFGMQYETTMAGLKARNQRIEKEGRVKPMDLSELEKMRMG